MENKPTQSGGQIPAVVSDDLLALLRSGPKFDYDGYKSAQLMQRAADEIERLRSEYKNLLGQVVQARDGFGIYRNSPTMAEAIEAGETYFFGANSQAQPREASR
jgi:hypothetical protein